MFQIRQDRLPRHRRLCPNVFQSKQGEVRRATCLPRFERGQSLGLPVEFGLCRFQFRLGVGEGLGRGFQLGVRLDPLLLDRRGPVEGGLELVRLAFGQGGNNVGLHRQVVIALGHLGRGPGLCSKSAGGLSH